ncbi:CBS domain-containing protein [Thiogranum longum]|uniref:CBS domain-containing protein n=1 Tax=Thiogranum longum TaxID=1537524 RepID=A0A4R1HGZ5_9GAMM|nr:CBS domain-containing protein [Thiogranum longum]TCK18629.1 CBS domain-containing protein [Thiogranum longum]
MRVSEVMTPDVRCCTPQTDLETVAMEMWNGDCGSIPVMDDNGTPVGMITDRDIAMAGALQHRALREITTGEVTNGRGVYCCNSEDNIESALQIMAEGHVRRLPVVDDAGCLQGILSADDVVAYAERGKRGKGKPELSFEDAIVTLKAVCKHH